MNLYEIGSPFYMRHPEFDMISIEGMSPEGDKFVPVVRIYDGVKDHWSRIESSELTKIFQYATAVHQVRGNRELYDRVIQEATNKVRQHTGDSKHNALIQRFARMADVYFPYALRVVEWEFVHRMAIDENAISKFVTVILRNRNEPQAKRSKAKR